MAYHVGLVCARIPGHHAPEEPETRGSSVDDGIPLTVPEVRRLVWQLLWSRPPSRAAVLAWSRWRRRHQWRARRAHYQSRGVTL